MFSKEKIISRYMKKHEILDAEKAAFQALGGLPPNSINMRPDGNYERTKAGIKYLRSLINQTGLHSDQEKFNKAYEKARKVSRSNINALLERGVMSYLFNDDAFRYGAAITIIVLVVVGWASLSWWHNHQGKIQLSGSVNKSNTEGRVTVDSVFSILMPCQPSTPEAVVEDQDYGSIASTCSVLNSDGSSKYLYRAENAVYKTNAESPLTEYNRCAAYKDSEPGASGESFLVIDNHIEDVHGIQFRICDVAGDQGTVAISARAVRNNTLQDFDVLTDGNGENNLWLKFRGYLESFNYIN